MDAPIRILRTNQQSWSWETEPADYYSNQPTSQLPDTDQKVLLKQVNPLFTTFSFSVLTWAVICNWRFLNLVSVTLELGWAYWTKFAFFNFLISTNDVLWMQLQNVQGIIKRINPYFNSNLVYSILIASLNQKGMIACCWLESLSDTVKKFLTRGYDDWSGHVRETQRFYSFSMRACAVRL